MPTPTSSERIRRPRADARGTLAVDRAVPVGPTDVAITFRLDTDADQATQDRLVTLAERYCVVAQTLASPPRLSVRRQDP